MPNPLKAADVARLAWLAIPKVGQRRVVQSYDQAFDPNASAADVLATLAPSLPADARADALDAAARLVELSREHEVAIVTLSDLAYPEPLRRIPDPPPFLYVRGELPRAWECAVAVIGTRAPSPLALEMTDELVDAFESRGDVVVVSGLAVGIDTRAHRRALSQGLRTVAVMGNGLDHVYPKINSKLAHEIVEHGGCLVSESPTGVGVAPFALIARDRIQSGLSCATFLVQSTIDGGSMHTAAFTLQQGRTLVALRPPQRHADWEGNSYLLGIQTTTDERIAARFRNYPAPLALPLKRELVPQFVRAGLDRGFVPRGRIATNAPSALSLPFGGPSA